LVILPGSVGADGDKSASGLEEVQRVGDVLNIRAVLERGIHQNCVEAAQVARRAAKTTLDRFRGYYPHVSALAFTQKSHSHMPLLDVCCC
jgi:hypothetical protein